MDIKIREIGLEDADFILEIENNTEIWKVSHTKEEFSKKEIELFIAKNILEGLTSNQKRWVITVDNENCGCIDIFDYNETNKRAGVGVVIHKKFQNKRIATIALKQFIEYCRDKLNLYQIYCTILEDNINSIKLFEKQGFVKYGERKDWTLYEGKYYNEVFYQLIF